MVARARGAGSGDDERPDVADLGYAEAGVELDAIIAEFESGVVDVDRLVEQLERATDIVDELDRRLRRTRLQVEELVPRLEAIGRREATHDSPSAGSSAGGDEEIDDDLPVETELDAAGSSSGDEPEGLF